MSGMVQKRPGSSDNPARVLVAGSDLLAGALAGALEACGFDTRHVGAREPEVTRGIEWRPNLVLIDVRLLDVTSGSALIVPLRQAGLPVCVIDAVGDGDRLKAWWEAGTSALIDKSEPFDRLVRTISHLLKLHAPSRPTPGSSAPLTSIHTTDRRQRERLQLLESLTEREQVVLAELMEGHCAEEIANAAFVSISTVRSQIKAILQKLGVNSQLAAVAMARRTGWTLNARPRKSPKPLERASSPRPGVA
jgi:two-component system, NarL family, nitrate/nitrite response regulator NarL